MASYGFFFRASTRQGGYPGRLYLRVVHGSASRSVTTAYRVFPGEWDDVGRRLLVPYDRSERSRQLADYESSMRYDVRRLEGVISKLEKDGAYTVDELMDYYRSVMTGNTLCAYTEKLASELERNGYCRTAKAYRTAALRLRNFNGGRDVDSDHFTAGLIGDFQQSLKAEGKSMNTISFYMRTLRSIYNKGIAEGRFVRRLESPFSGVYTGVSPTRKRALTADELALLSSFDPTARSVRQELSDGLKQALVMFLFCYHARGMCFVDLAYLKKSDLKGDRIRYCRRKTGQLMEIRIQPAMRRILDWLAPLTTGSRYLFPVITDPDKDPRLQYESGLRLQNLRLKRLSALLGLNKRFSTHVARHSWATVAKNEGLPLAVISEGLGHTNQRTTEIYLASLGQPVLDRASRMVSEAICPDRQTKKGRNHTGESSGGLPGFRTYGSRYGRYR